MKQIKLWGVPSALCKLGLYKRGLIDFCSSSSIYDYFGYNLNVGFWTVPHSYVTIDHKQTERVLGQKLKLYVYINFVCIDYQIHMI